MARIDFTEFQYFIATPIFVSPSVSIELPDPFRAGQLRVGPDLPPGPGNHGWSDVFSYI